MNTIEEETELYHLKEYAESLDNLALSKSLEKFPNKNPKHAAIALTKILKYSHEHFIIFDDNLHGDIVNNIEVVSFIDTLKRFLRRGGTVVFVIREGESDKDDKSLITFLKTLTELYPTRMKIKKASDDFIAEMEKKKGKDINMAIGDNTMYRIETGKKDSDKNTNTRQAEVCFNNKEVVDELSSVFNAHISKLNDYFKKQERSEK